MGLGGLGDLDATDLGDVVVHAGLVELNLGHEVLGELLLGLLLALVVLGQNLGLNLLGQLLVQDLGPGTVESVLAVAVEPSLGLESAGGDVLAVLLDDSVVGGVNVWKGHLVQALVDD